MFCGNIKVNRKLLTQLSTPISQPLEIRGSDRAIPATYEPRNINTNYKAALFIDRE